MYNLPIISEYYQSAEDSSDRCNNSGVLKVTVDTIRVGGAPLVKLNKQYLPLVMFKPNYKLNTKSYEIPDAWKNSYISRNQTTLSYIVGSAFQSYCSASKDAQKRYLKRKQQEVAQMYWLRFLNSPFMYPSFYELPFLIFNGFSHLDNWEGFKDAISTLSYTFVMKCGEYVANSYYISKTTGQKTDILFSIMLDVDYYPELIYNQLAGIESDPKKLKVVVHPALESWRNIEDDKLQSLITQSLENKEKLESAGIPIEYSDSLYDEVFLTIKDEKMSGILELQEHRKKELKEYEKFVKNYYNIEESKKLYKPLLSEPTLNLDLDSPWNPFNRDLQVEINEEEDEEEVPIRQRRRRRDTLQSEEVPFINMEDFFTTTNT